MIIHRGLLIKNLANTCNTDPNLIFLLNKKSLNMLGSDKVNFDNNKARTFNEFYDGNPAGTIVNNCLAYDKLDMTDEQLSNLFTAKIRVVTENDAIKVYERFNKALTLYLTYICMNVLAFDAFVDAFNGKEGRWYLDERNIWLELPDNGTNIMKYATHYIDGDTGEEPSFTIFFELPGWGDFNNIISIGYNFADLHGLLDTDLEYKAVLDDNTVKQGRFNLKNSPTNKLNSILNEIFK